MIYVGGILIFLYLWTAGSGTQNWAAFLCDFLLMEGTNLFYVLYTFMSRLSW